MVESADVRAGEAARVDDGATDSEDSPTTAAPGRPWRPALVADLRGAIPDFSVALLLTASVWLLLWWRIENERSETVQVMADMALGRHWAYWLSQAFGWAAFLWAWGTVVLGLLVAGKRPTWVPGSTRTIERLHRTTSLSVIGLTLAHMLTMVFDWGARSDNGLNVLDTTLYSFVPLTYGAGLGGKIYLLTGQIAFYLAMVLGLSYYWRHRLGVRAWRFAHRFSILVYAFAAWHTFIYGTNVWFTGYQRTLLWAMQVPIAALVLYRLLEPLRRSERLPLRPGALVARLDVMVALRLAVRLVAAAAVVVLVGILALNRTGGHQRPAEYPTMESMDHEAAP